MKQFIFFTILIFARILVGLPQENKEMLKGLAAFRETNYSDAVQYLTKAIQTDMHCGQCLIYRGKAFLMEQDYKSAEKDFLKASELTTPEATLQLAILYAQQHEPKICIKYLRDYIIENPGINTIELLKNKSLSPIYDTEEWFGFISGFKHAKKWEIISTIEYLVKSTQFQEAHLQVDAMLEKNPTDIDLLQAKASIYKQEGNLTLAAYELSKAKEISPENATILSRLGQINMTEGNYAQAIANFEEAKRFNPSDFDLYLKLTDACLLGENTEKALTEISEYLYLFPDSKQAQFKLAKVNFELKKYNSTLQVINTLMASDKNNREWLLLRGKTYYEGKIYKSAAYDLSMYLDLDPTSSEANYYLGLTQLKLGNQKSACYYMKRAFNAGDARAIQYLTGSCQ
jgi:tetratricopeptide (TPR) repeat protein